MWLREVGWSLRRTANVFRRWYFDVSDSDQMNIPTLIDKVLNGQVVQTHAKIDALQEQHWQTTLHSQEILEKMRPQMYQCGKLGIIYLQQDNWQACQLLDFYLHHNTIVRESIGGHDMVILGDWVVISVESRFCLDASDVPLSVQCKLGCSSTTLSPNS